MMIRSKKWLVLFTCFIGLILLLSGCDRDRELKQVLLTVEKEGQGVVIPELGVYEKPQDTVMELQARPEDGWEFSHWKGEVAEKNNSSTTVLVDKNKTVIAVFTNFTSSPIVLEDLGEKGNLQNTDHAYNIIDNTELIGVWSVSIRKSKLPESWKGYQLRIQDRVFPFTVNIFDEDMLELNVLKTYPIDEIKKSLVESSTLEQKQQVVILDEDIGLGYLVIQRETSLYGYGLYATDPSTFISMRNAGEFLFDDTGSFITPVYVGSTEDRFYTVEHFVSAKNAGDGTISGAFNVLLDYPEWEESIQFGTVTIEEGEIVVDFPQAEFTEGTGTEEDPYLVSSPAQLHNVRNYLDQHFLQTQDIDLAHYSNWDPIGVWYGEGYAENEMLTGTYDGGDYKIQNLTIDGINNVGLFAITSEDSVLRNIHLEDVNIKGNDSVGSLVGLHYGTIINCSVNGAITGYYIVGGLVGYSHRSTITDCYSSGDVTGYNTVGGLVGHSSESTITDCYSSGDVTGGEWSGSVGGLVGHSCWGSTITGCYSSGDVTGEERVGGLVGSAYGTTITDCYSSGNVSGDDRVGGLVGELNWSDVMRCYAVGEVTGVLGLGGLIGIRSETSVEYSYYDQETTGRSDDMGKGIPKTTSEMLQQDTFEEWDFDEIWGIDEGETYPYLQWQASDTYPTP